MLVNELLVLVFTIGIVISLLIYSIQLVMTIKFLKKTKHVKKVGPITKWLIVSGNFSGISMILAQVFAIVYYMTGIAILQTIAFFILFFLSEIPFAYNFS